MKQVQSTVLTILKDKDRVKETMKVSTSFKAIVTIQRKGLFNEMDKLLLIWFDDQVKNNVSELFSNSRQGTQYL